MRLPLKMSGRARGIARLCFPSVEIPDVEITEQFLYEREELIMGLSFALAKSARAERSLADRPLMDRDLIAAVSSLAKSYQTLVNSSLIYEPADRQPGAPGHRSRSRDHGPGVSRGRGANISVTIGCGIPTC